MNKTVANQKWDRIKVVCTQPYNKVTVSLVKVPVFKGYNPGPKVVTQINNLWILARKPEKI